MPPMQGHEPLAVLFSDCSKLAVLGIENKSKCSKFFILKKMSDGRRLPSLLITKRIIVHPLALGKRLQRMVVPSEKGF